MLRCSTPIELASDQSKAFGALIHKRSIGRKQSGVIGKGLEFKRVATWIAEKHRFLFTDKPGKARCRGHHKGDTGVGKARGQRVKTLHIKYNTEMGHRDIMAIDDIGHDAFMNARREMRDDLMSKKAEIDPFA